MPTYTTTYSLGKPVVGADEDAWGDTLNASLDSIDDILDGTTPVTGIDINSGTLDGVTIGGTTAGAGTFTTLTANTSITGTLATAAQPNITSVGSLTSLDVAGTLTSDGLTVDGTSALNNNVTITQSSSPVLTFTSYPGTQDTVATIYSGRSEFSGTNSFLRFGTNDGTSTKLRMDISQGGDLSLYEDTGTTAKFFWDASAESLGIGTSSPSGRLSLQGAAGTNGKEQGILLKYSNGTEYGALGLNNSSGWPQLMARAGAGITFHTNSDLLTTNEAMRIDSSGQVGIGTTSPTSKLHLYKTGTSDNIINIQNGQDAYASILSLTANNDGGAVYNSLQSSTNGGTQHWKISGGASTSTMAFSTGGSERMRIDSSGILLVGKTSAAYGTAGVRIDGGGFTQNTRDGDITAYYNRLTSDGAIVEFAKDGSPVGSIASRSGVVSSIILDPRSSGSGLTGGYLTVVPSDNTGAVTDGTRDLGTNSGRWKDLWLSGGVYLGGTGSANKLDDYETGTWTPTFTSWTTNPTSASGRYTKVGRLVLITFVGVGGAKASSTSAYIEGLPFAIQGSGAVGSVSNSGVADYGNVLFQNTDRMWFTNNSFTSTWYASGVYETTA